MSEESTQITSAWQPTDFSKTQAEPVKHQVQRPPRNAGTRKLLTRLPVAILALAYIYEFLLTQLPEFDGVHALHQIGIHASVLVWGTLPGLGHAGAHGTVGFLMMLAIIGAVALPITARRPSLRLASIPAAALVALGIIARVIQVQSQSWSPMPIGGLLLGVVIAVAALLAVREILLTDPAQLATPGYGRRQWRLTWVFVLILISFVGAIAIGRYFEPSLVTAVRAAPPAVRWHYLNDKSSGWMFGLGALIVVIGFALVQLLPPWDGRAKQLVIAVILIIAAVVAFQQVRPSADRAVTHVVLFGPSDR